MLSQQLTSRANEAGDQVQSIAIKAIEGATSQRLYFGSGPSSANPEKGGHQTSPWCEWQRNEVNLKSHFIAQ